MYSDMFGSSVLNPITDNREPTTEFEGMISEGELVDLMKKLKPAIENYNKISKYGPLSFFEVRAHQGFFGYYK